jgi:hypothetical protein
MKAFFKFSAWTALALGLTGLVLGVLTALGVQQGWFGSHDVQLVLGDRLVKPAQMSAADVALLAGVLGLVFFVVFMLLGLLLPLGVLLVAGAAGLAMLLSIPFLGLSMIGGLLPYLLVGLLIWGMWRIAHPKPRAQASANPDATAASPAGNSPAQGPAGGGETK